MNAFARLGTLVLALVMLGGFATTEAARRPAGPLLPVGQEEQEGRVSVQARFAYRAVPGVFEGAPCDRLTAAWRDGVGREDRNRETSFGLVLSKGCATNVPAAAGADIRGEQGRTLRSLGFDYKGDCGAGAPRFDVFTELRFDREGNVTRAEGYFVGCQSGSQTAQSDDFFRVRFQEEDFVPFGGETEPFRFSNTQVEAIQIIQDEQGRVVLDNINISDVLIDGPGKVEPSS